MPLTSGVPSDMYLGSLRVVEKDVGVSQMGETLHFIHSTNSSHKCVQLKSTIV